jgi:3-hydroxy acid dehydrogenase / malonic semialdehyde reductase
MSKIVFITGATSGFGKAAATLFAQAGFHLIINGRRNERLSEIATELQAAFKVEILPLAFDVRDESAVNEAINSLPPKWKAIDVLVNNAGLALGRDFFEEGSTEDWNVMIDTNVKGFLYVAKAVAKLMSQKETINECRGHIINLGSVAGKDVYEKGNVYCGTKFAVDAISKAMRIDLLRHHIKVTAIHPGAAETEFSIVRFKGDAETAKSVYNGLKPLSAEDVAATIFWCATQPPHVCINDLTITCTRQADGIFFNRS